MVRLLTLVVAVWLVSLESCYGYYFCDFHGPSILHEGKEYEFNFEECNASFVFEMPTIKLYGPKCSDTSHLYEPINETHFRRTTVNSNGVISGNAFYNYYVDSSFRNIYAFASTACYHPYVY